MAFVALGPLAFVFAAVNGKIISIVRRVHSRCPVRVGGVALRAIGREPGCNVVGRLRRSVILLVAGIALIGGIGKIARIVAFSAVGNFMPFGEREKIVFYFIGFPCACEGVVALDTIGRKPGCFVVGIDRSVIIRFVTADAVVPNSVKLQGGGRGVALIAGNGLVYPCQWKSVLYVQVRHPVYHPVGAGVAAGTIGAYCLLVHIYVAGQALGTGVRKNQCLVTCPAVDRRVAPFQSKFGFVVVEYERITAQCHAGCFGSFVPWRGNFLPIGRIDFPARRGVAGRTVDLQIRAVRVLRMDRCDKTEE